MNSQMKINNDRREKKLPKQVCGLCEEIFPQSIKTAPAPQLCSEPVHIKTDMAYMEKVQ